MLHIYIYTHVICLPDFSNPCKSDRSNYSNVSGLKTSQLSDVVTHSDRRRMSLQPNLLQLVSGSLIGIAFLAREREREWGRGGGGGGDRLGDSTHKQRR